MPNPSRLTLSLVSIGAALCVAAGPSAQQSATSTPPGPGAAAVPAGALEFTLSAEGLPQKGFWKSTPTLVNLNQDGLLDLVAHERVGAGAGAWLGDGKGGWKDLSDSLKFGRGSCGGGIKVADINKDGRLDLVVGDHCSGVWVFLGDGKGRWETITKELNPAISQKDAPPEGEMNIYRGTEDLAIADVDGDGFLDIVTSASDRGGFSLYLGDGSGKAWKQVTDMGLPDAQHPPEADNQDGGWANEMLVADMNKDGHADVLAAYYTGPRVYLGDGKAKFREASEGLPKPLVGGLFRGLAVADVNEDGRLDFTVANAVNGAEVYLQQENGSWKATGDPMPALRGGAEAVDLFDVDGDGHLDLVVGGRLTKGIGDLYGLFVIRGDGRGGWTQVPTNLPQTGLRVTWGLAHGDVNGDKLPDFAVGTGGEDQKIKKDAPPPLPFMQVWLNSPKNQVKPS